MSGVQKIFSLYRQIVRTNRALPSPMKELGGAYAREEFRTHLSSDKMTEAKWHQFIASWEQYVASLRGQSNGTSVVSGDLEEDVITQLSPEQRQQLDRLKNEALRFGDGASNK